MPSELACRGACACREPFPRRLVLSAPAAPRRARASIFLFSRGDKRTTWSSWHTAADGRDDDRARCIPLRCARSRLGRVRAERGRAQVPETFFPENISASLGAINPRAESAHRGRSDDGNFADARNRRVLIDLARARIFFVLSFSGRLSRFLKREVIGV